VFESLDDIIDRVQKRHDLEGPPTDEELTEHLPPIIPPTLENHVRSYSVSGNVLTIFLGDQTSRQELSLLAPRMCKQLNARLGRNAISKISTRTKK
jgi:hypothetical protein